MRTIDLREKDLTLEDALKLASSGTVNILARDGHEYTLEEADEFEREVAALGRSEKFMQFLEERRADPERIPLAEVKKRLAL